MNNCIIQYNTEQFCILQTVITQILSIAAQRVTISLVMHATFTNFNRNLHLHTTVLRNNLSTYLPLYHWRRRTVYSVAHLITEVDQYVFLNGARRLFTIIYTSIPIYKSTDASKNITSHHLWGWDNSNITGNSNYDKHWRDLKVVIATSTNWTHSF